MYLHSAEEIAELLDLGFVASPGTHNLIGIKMEEVIMEIIIIISHNYKSDVADNGTRYYYYYYYSVSIKCNLPISIT